MIAVYMLDFKQCLLFTRHKLALEKEASKELVVGPVPTNTASLAYSIFSTEREALQTVREIS